MEKSFMANVENKKTSPVIALVANWLVFGILGYILIGQTNKGIKVLIAAIIGSILCVLPGLVVAILGLVDVFQTAKAIESGEEVDENEYKNELLYKIVKNLHKEAIFKGASAGGDSSSEE